MTDNAIYVSITGLRLKKPWHVFRFYWLALQALRQARKAAGNLTTEAKTIGGIHHTLTVWESRAAMQGFLYVGAHKRAIAAFGKIATGKTFGFAADRVPSWEEVPEIWGARGREYGA
jgi:hypothetical protein